VPHGGRAVECELRLETIGARRAQQRISLHELREAGLTGAIVHASKILPKNRIPEEQWNAALDSDLRSSS